MILRQVSTMRRRLRNEFGIWSSWDRDTNPILAILCYDSLKQKFAESKRGVAMMHYCQTKKDLLKEIKWWLEHIDKDDEISINIKGDPAIENTFILNISEKPKFSSPKARDVSHE